MKFVTIIPARGGSKRFPGKNVHPLAEKPLICHSIDYSLNCKSINRTYVSTDADDIKMISQTYGAEIIDRPAEYAGDFATTASALKHAVQYLIDNGVEFDYVVLLQPTNPLRPKNLLDTAIGIIETNMYDSLFTISLIEKKLGKVINDKYIPWNYKYGQRSQDLDPLYYENGLLYITHKNLLLQEIIESPQAYPLVVNHQYGEVDIDTIQDFRYAEYVLKHYSNE